jgi:hypothetical protein
VQPDDAIEDRVFGPVQAAVLLLVVRPETQQGRGGMKIDLLWSMPWAPVNMQKCPRPSSPCSSWTPTHLQVVIKL